jgi:hypothetical protein
MKLNSKHISAISTWFDQIDPGVHRRVKGLRLVTAYGLAALLATLPEISHGRGQMLGALAAGFALWASVSEGQGTRYASARDRCCSISRRAEVR